MRAIRGDKMDQNRVKRIREQLLMSKAELARMAEVSPLTIDRIEKGLSLWAGNEKEDYTGPRNGPF